MKDINFAGNAKEMTDFLGNTWHYSCTGCAIANHEITPPGGIIYEDESFTIQHDPEIPIKGFLIINTKRHIKSLIELTDKERLELMNLLNVSIKSLKDLKIAEEVTIVQEERSNHFHMWVFPYHAWMKENFGKGVSYLRDISAFAQENATLENKQEILTVIDNIREYINKYKEKL